jgi:formylglycine-generating enzyme
MMFRQSSPSKLPPAEMAWIPGGTFWMGSDHFYPEEAPAHQVTVDGFWLDRFAVSNAQFQSFVESTGYVTVAERPLDPKQYPGVPRKLLVPGSLVFRPPSQPVGLSDYSQWWSYVPGANWRHPEGPRSTLTGCLDHPVVHVSYKDAEAYANWTQKALPTEAEWEFAARGGLDRAIFPWGNQFAPEGKMMANTWQGEFPHTNLALDGYIDHAPVGAFAPNAYGLYDMVGNVWEWTCDWYTSKHPENAAKPCCIPVNPKGGASTQSYDPETPKIKIPRKVLKGGSYLCAPNYCLRYRPSARSAQAIDTATCHIGFRCIQRPANPS